MPRGKALVASVAAPQGGSRGGSGSGSGNGSGGRNGGGGGIGGGAGGASRESGHTAISLLQATTGGRVPPVVQ